jgi:ribosomal protein S18 acetylase RimI-like enzyme
MAHQNIKLRPARLSDLGALVAIENKCFQYDQLSRRNFHWMIKHAHSIFLVLEFESVLVGYGLVLINSGTSLARLYSICTLQEYQGLGLAKKLIASLEEKACEANCAFLRLEVKDDNMGAIALYEKLGYRRFTVKSQYYEDGRSAFCYEKQIRVFKKASRLKVPFYQQKTDFTCGPACLMMAMKAFEPKRELALSEELQIWREATTIFMTSGHGGCGPQGLALSALTRGFKAELYLSHSDALFVDTVRSQEKKEIITLVQEDFEKKLKKKRVRIHRKRLTLADLRQILDKGGIPILLISTYHFDRNRIPHWVVITAYDDHFIYLHDPDQDTPGHHTGVIAKVHVPVPQDQFLKISRWGKEKMGAAVVIHKRLIKRKS